MITENKRGVAGYLPSWISSCGGNPTVNEILQDIDENAQSRQYATVGFSDKCDFVCDGTADDVQIQECADYAEANGLGMYIEQSLVDAPGFYDIRDEILLPNIFVNGLFNKTFLKAHSSLAKNKSIFKNNDTVGGNEYILIDNIDLDGNFLNRYTVSISGLTVTTILWQSGNTIRISFSGSPDLSSVLTTGTRISVTGATNASNNGVFRMTAVNNTSKYVDITNDSRSDATDDETPDSPATADIQDLNTSGNNYGHNICMWNVLSPVIGKGVRSHDAMHSGIGFVDNTKWGKIIAAEVNENQKHNILLAGENTPTQFNKLLANKTNGAVEFVGLELALGAYDNYVAFNTSNENGEGGSHVFYESKRNVLVFNTFEDNLQNGISIVDEADDNVFAYNTIRRSANVGIAFVLSGFHPTATNGGKHNKIFSNTIEDCGWNGIRSSNRLENSDVFDNEIVRCGLLGTGTQQYAMYIPTVVDVQIERNKWSECAKGSYIASAYNAKFKNNSGRASVDDDFYFDSVDTLTNIDIEDLEWQYGNIIRATLNGSPDLVDIHSGMTVKITNAINPSNDGTFKIYAVDSALFTIDFVNLSREDATDDELATTATMNVSWGITNCDLGDNASKDAGGYGMLFIEGLSESNARYCKVTGSAQTGIEVRGGYDTNFDGSEVSECAIGFKITDDANGVTSREIHGAIIARKNTNVGITVVNSVDTDLTGSKTILNGKNGLTASGAEGFKFDHHVIRKNGFTAVSNADKDGAYIENCTIVSMDNGSVSGNARRGIEIIDCVKIQAKNNEGGDQVVDIFLDYGSTGVEDFDLSGNTFSGSSSDSIRCEKSATNGVIAMNNISNCGGTAIGIKGSDNINLFGNNGHDNAGYGCSLSNLSAAPFTGATNVKIHNNFFNSNTLGGISESGSSDDNEIYDNDLQNNVGANLAYVGASTRVSNNKGYVTENKGSTSILSGTTQITVNHGLSYTPSINDFVVTAMNNPTNNVGTIYVLSTNATQVTIACENDPGASNLNLAWRVSKE